MEGSKKNRILVVDDEKSNLLYLSSLLGAEHTLYIARDGLEAIEKANEYLPDLIMLDIIMPGMNGYEVLSILKSTERTRDIPVIIITGLSSNEDETKGLMLGAGDYISKPFHDTIVQLRIQQQLKIVNQMQLIEQLTMTDQLTSIPNRRGFDIRMEIEWARATRENMVISLLILDIDFFKVYNDTYGHQQGDIVLQAVAQNLINTLNRQGDFAARWGGEEFVILLPNTDRNGALKIAERILLSTSNMLIPCVNGTDTKVTVSIGLNTVIPEKGTSYDTFISAADQALYKAKESGRNQVCCSD